MDGATSNSEDRILVSKWKQLSLSLSLFSLLILFLFLVGATNIPWDIDEAVLRFVCSSLLSFFLIILILLSSYHFYY
jgi:SpoVK/Ycf46/Vps4 family AAA+-type ATPase